MAYSAESLEGAILKCKDNIKIFEEAINKERETIKEYRAMIDHLEDKKLGEITNNIFIEIERDGD